MRKASRMFRVGTLSALISTERTPLDGAPTTTPNDHGVLPASPKLIATPPVCGRRRFSVMLLKVEVLPRCWSSITSVPFLRPISLRFWPSSPVRLRLSSHSSPARRPLGDGFSAAGTGGVGSAWTSGATCPGGSDSDGPDGTGMVGGMTGGATRGVATPVASGRALSPVETVTSPSGMMRTASTASTRLRLSARSRPISIAGTDNLTSALGALATMA